MRRGASYIIPCLLLSISQVSIADDVLVSGHAVTERYWDCCKPDCSWPARADFNQPAQVCNADNNPLTDFNVASSCGGGSSYQCANQHPWAVNDTFSYGFAGVYLMEKLRDSWCCACYELTFTSGEVKGKKMVVQAHNSGFDMLTANRFALAVCQASFLHFCLFAVSLTYFGAHTDIPRFPAETPATQIPAQNSTTCPTPPLAWRERV